MTEDINPLDFVVLNYMSNAYPVLYYSKSKTAKEVEKEIDTFKKCGYKPTDRGWRNDPRRTW